MVVLNRIYTRGGDGGETALGDGARLSKASPRVDSMGAVDEANAAIGLARAQAGKSMGAALARVQNDLFDLGADLCRPVQKEEASSASPPLRVSPSQTARLEREIDAMNARLSPLRSFVLPGGNALAAHLHLARTFVRRAERRVVGLSAVEGRQTSGVALCYLNRLSDWLFVAARIANDEGRGDILWEPGKTRKG